MSVLITCPALPGPGQAPRLRNALTHPHGLVLHVDGGDAGSEEQGSPAGYTDSVKVSVILDGGEGVGPKKPPKPL